MGYKLYTIGYARYRTFSILKQVMPWHPFVVDVRRTPYCSWNKDFCKDVLEKELDYVHDARLGNMSSTLPYVPHNDVDDAVFEISFQIREHKDTVVLLCAESEFDRCHRTDVAKRIAGAFPEGLEIIHL